jgi:hypothetical protein
MIRRETRITPSLEQTLPPPWQNPAARRMKLSGRLRLSEKVSAAA